MNGLVMLDVATRYLDREPSECRDAETIEMTLRCFAGDVKVRRCPSDNDDSLNAAANKPRWKHDFIKPHDPQSNGLIEARVGIVKAGACAFLYRAGMPAMCWPWAVKSVCQMNIYKTDTTSTEILRHRVMFSGMTGSSSAYGCPLALLTISYQPITFAKKLHPKWRRTLSLAFSLVTM